MLGTLARRYTLSASVRSCKRTISPSSSLHVSLFSFNHFSNSCFLPCCNTGRASSRDSRWLSSPFSSRIPKYCRMGDSPPGGAGAVLNDSMTWVVRRMPYEQRSTVKTHIACRREESTTYTRRVGSNFSSFTKLTTCEELLVLLHLRSSAPGRVLFRVVRIYGMIVCSSTLTLGT